MAFGDWTFYTTGTAVASLSSITPISGTSSLKMAVSGTSATPIIAGYLTAGIGFPHGFTRGAIRTLLKPVTLGAPTGRMVGVFCQSSTRAVSATAYIAGISNGNTLVLWKGAMNGSPSSLGTYAYTPVNGTTIALELEWLALPDEMNGTSLTVRFAESDDFNDLTDIITYVDSSTPYFVSRGEGVITNTTFFSSNASEYSFDETSIYRID